jgi:hypothetical protein
MNGPVLIPICSWFLTALSDFFNSLLGQDSRFQRANKLWRQKGETQIPFLQQARVCLPTVCHYTNSTEMIDLSAAHIQDLQPALIAYSLWPATRKRARQWSTLYGNTAM